MKGEKVEIQTKLGKLRGQTKQCLLSNKTYYTFQGIPFAKPPIGDLRFKAPVPFGSWEGIRDALEDGPDPLQPLFFPMPGMDPNQISNGNEDCLFLNICFNELPEENSTKKPVMVSVHGGGFGGGSGALKASGPEYFMEEDIVFVAFNYRCGPFGFLNLENEDVPGNAGLKDQVLALQWVQDNIESFGGDPNNVTIFGISAGGASVDYQLISPLSKGLFHKAIVQSGFTYSSWGFQTSPKRLAIKLAKALGCTSENCDDILETLKSAAGDDIIASAKKVSREEKEFLMSCYMVFSPSVEVCGTNKFLPDSPEKILERGEFNKVPVIVGLAELEGVMHLGTAILNKISEEELVSLVNNNPQLLVPALLRLKSGSDEEKEVTKAIWDFYFKGEPLSLDNFYEYMSYQSDLLFNIGFGMTRTALVEKSSSPVYTYLFTNHTRCVCSSLKNMFPEGGLFTKFTAKGTCHGADCHFLYVYTLLAPPELTPESKEAIVKHIKAWTKFASTGHPNCKELQVTWERDSENRPFYMDIGTRWELKEGTPFAERFAFWKKICSKYSF